MSFLAVFLPSVVLTLVILLFLVIVSPAMRRPRAMTVFASVATMAHLLWWRLPDLHGELSVIGRWLISVWVSAVLAAVILIVPTLLVLTLRRRLGGRTASGLGVPLVFTGLATAIGAVVSLGSAGDPVVREETVHIPNLPAPLDGLRIANVGDVHIGRFMVPADLARTVDIVNDRNVDLLTITGDLIDDLTQLEPTLDALERSRTRPVLGVLGNHDKMANEAVVLAAYRRRAPRIDLLVNGSILVDARGARVRIVGADYPLDVQGGHMLPRPQQDAAMKSYADQAFAKVQPGETIIALSHHPDFFPFAAARGAVLTLASHTHGGQVAFFGHPVIAAYDYMQGPYTLGSSHLDVSAGVGHWLPIRIGVPREIVIVTLRR